MFSGSTWLQEILYQIQTGVDTESDDSRVDISLRVPLLEASMPGFPSGLDLIESSPPPHLMKSHLYAHFFQKQIDARKAKFIVIMRNVKDNLVSYFHVYRMPKFTTFFQACTWEEFFKMVRDKRLIYGDWLEFNLSWWKQKERTNVLILKYEDMKRDLRSAILAVAGFVGKSLSEEQLNRLVDHTSFSRMRENEAVNYTQGLSAIFNNSSWPFFRRGVVGAWESLFTPEQNEFIELMYVNAAKEHSLNFEYKST